jgi:hypothetical protein
MAQFSAHRQDWFGSVTNSNIFEVIMMADKDGNIINSSGISSNINIAAGLVDGWASIHKFGAVPAMSQGQSGTIWDINDTPYPWSAFNTPGILTISTTTSNGTLSSLDDGVTVHVLGLDENFEEVEDTFTISGNSATGTVSFKRVYRAYIDGADANQTQIRVSRDTTEVLRINIGKSQTLMALYTVPAGKTAYLIQGTSTCAANADATVDMFVRYFGQDSFRIGHTLEVAGVGGQYTYQFGVPLPIPEKSDLDIRADVRANNARITAAFDILLVDNEI